VLLPLEQLHLLQRLLEFGLVLYQLQAQRSYPQPLLRLFVL
jgi:hypothetical protein